MFQLQKLESKLDYLSFFRVDISNISNLAARTGAGLFAEGATRGLQERSALERDRLQGFAGILSALFNRDS